MTTVKVMMQVNNDSGDGILMMVEETNDSNGEDKDKDKDKENEDGDGNNVDGNENKRSFNRETNTRVMQSGQKHQSSAGLIQASFGHMPT